MSHSGDYQFVYREWDIVCGESRADNLQPNQVVTTKILTDNVFGFTMQEARIKLRKSLEDVAKLSGVDTSTLAMVERGAHMPDEQMKQRISAALHL